MKESQQHIEELVAQSQQRSLERRQEPPNPTLLPRDLKSWVIVLGLVIALIAIGGLVSEWDLR